MTSSWLTSCSPTRWGNHNLEWGLRTYVMGIVNATPDSFSGDGVQSDEDWVQRAVTQALHFVSEGAAMIDVGGESTRPQATLVSVEQEIERVVPVIQALRVTLPTDVIISIDTYKAEVAKRALIAGADLVNDISALQYDPAMADVVAQHQVPMVLMANMRGYHRREIVSDVTRFLAAAIDRALAANISWEHIIIDPGIGFGMTPEENLTVLRRLSELHTLGRPILLGTSRKSTLGRVLGGLPPTDLLEGTAATVALGVAQGIDIVRVHDVHEMMRVVKMSDAVVRSTFVLS